MYTRNSEYEGGDKKQVFPFFFMSSEDKESNRYNGNLYLCQYHQKGSSSSLPIELIDKSIKASLCVPALAGITMEGHNSET